MRSLNQTIKKLYSRKPKKIFWYVHLFARVTGRYMAGLSRNWKIITPRGMKTTLKTWSMHTSFLMNTTTGIQVQPPHQQMDLHLLRRAQKRTTIETITIEMFFHLS